MLRRLAGSDGSQGVSADYEVAVGQQQERKSFGRRDEPEPGPTACGEVATWSDRGVCRSGVVRSPGRTGTGADGRQRCRVDAVVVVETKAESVSGSSGRSPNTE